MADEGYDRDFPGNPNPAPKPPAARSVPAAPAAESTGGGGQTTATAAPAPVVRPKARYQVVDAPTGYEIYADTAEESSEHIGTAKIPEAAEVLKASGAYYNETAKLWEDVPEDVVRSLQSGKMGLPEYVFARYKQGEVGALRSALGAKIVNGEMSVEEAMARGNEALLKAQVSSEPELAFNGGFKKFAIEAMQSPRKLVRYALGAVAENLPNVRDAILADLKGQVKGAAAGAGAAVAGLATGPVAPATASAALAGGALIGGEWQSWKFFVDSNMGETAIGMAEKGFDAKTIQKWAPLAGVIKGTMDKASFGLLTAPAKQTFIAKVLNLPVIKRAIASAYVQYAASIGAEATTEAAQTYVDQVVNNMAATAVNRPDLFADPEKSKDELLDSAFQALFSAAAVGGAAQVAGKAMASVASAGERKMQAKTTAKLEEYRKAAPVAESPASKAEAPVPVSAPAAEVAAAPEATPAAQALDTAEAQPESPEAAKAAVEAVSQEAEKAPTKVEIPLAQRVRDIERKSEITRIQAELKDVDAQLAELSVDRDARIVNKQTTAHLDSRVDALVKQGENLRAQLAYQEQGIAGMPGAEEAVDRRADVTLSAATLEDIVEAGFKEGSKESKTRARKLLAITQEQGLNRADVNKILKNKVLGTMGDREFETYTEDFQARAEQAAARKASYRYLQEVRKEKRIKKEAYLRQAVGLPPVAQMTPDQLSQFAMLLDEYDKGDEAMPPKLVAALASSGTHLAGARTLGEVRKRTEARMGVPLDSLKLKPLGESEAWAPDSHLAKNGPFQHFLVTMAKAFGYRGAVVADETTRTLYKLGAAAVVGMRRRMTVWQRIGDMFVAGQKDLRAYIESPADVTVEDYPRDPEDPAPTAEEFKRFRARIQAEHEMLRAKLSPEELALAEFWIGYATEARKYLLETHALESTRFAEDYVPHIARPMSEILWGIKDTGVKAAVKEILTQWKQKAESMTAVDKSGQALSYQKFMKQTLHRSGEMTPSENIIKAMDIYIQQYSNKRALDAMISPIMAVTNALKTIDESEEGQAIYAAWVSFIKDFLNTKKGNPPALGRLMKKGGMAEGVLRFSSTLAALKYIALSAKIQSLAWVGETMAEHQIIGGVAGEGILKAKYLRMTKEGRRLLANHKAFLGMGVVEQFMAPGRTAEERLGLIAYGTFKAYRRHVLGDLLVSLATPEELRTGQISDERIAEIKLEIGRWMDIHGSKSIVGSSVLVSTWSQFKGWAIPPARTTGENLMSLGRTITRLGDEKKRMTPKQWGEMLRQVESGALALFAMSQLSADDGDDDTFKSRMRKTLVNELSSMWSIGSLLTLAAPGPALLGQIGTQMSRMGAGLVALYVLHDEDKAFDEEGNLKGWTGLKKTLTPATVKEVRQMLGEE